MYCVCYVCVYLYVYMYSLQPCTCSPGLKWDSRLFVSTYMYICIVCVCVSLLIYIYVFSAGVHLLAQARIGCVSVCHDLYVYMYYVCMCVYVCVYLYVYTYSLQSNACSSLLKRFLCVSVCVCAYFCICFSDCVCCCPNTRTQSHTPPRAHSREKFVSRLPKRFLSYKLHFH